MKRLLISVLMLAALGGLGGCAVVPYNAAYADPYGAPYGVPYGAAYVAQPAYAPVYVGPPVYFGFGLNIRSGGHRGGFRGWR